MSDPSIPAPLASQSFAGEVRRAVLWRSGSQIASQLVQWAATFLVIRILTPADYGLFAMTQVVLVFLNMLNGHGLASGMIRQNAVSGREVRQVFGMLILLNVALAATQLAIAPLAAAYYRQPEVATLLRVQALLYLPTPFIALPAALLARAMDFRHQARANILASIGSAATALGGALAGLGIWTLVLAPLALFTLRALLMTAGARSLVWPSFDFRGAGHLARYGGILAAGQFFWFAQSQADVFIAGRHFAPATLGLYTTALFLAQIFVAKFVPPLNEVAFSAYAKLGRTAGAGEPGAVARAFERAVGIVMLAALPFYLGLFATAEPLVQTMLGAKWGGVAPLVRLLALAMPFMTLQVLFTPACDARGHPGIGVSNGAWGAAILGTAFLVGVQGGPLALAGSWLIGYPVYLAVSARRAFPAIGTSVAAIGAVIRPPLVAAVAMALLVTLVDDALPALAAPLRLAILVGTGAASYGAWLALFSRPLLRGVAAVIRAR